MHTRVILTCKQEIIGAMFALYCGLFVIFRVPAEYRGEIQARFDFVVGVTNFRREGVLCIAKRICVLRLFVNVIVISSKLREYLQIPFSINIPYLILYTSFPLHFIRFESFDSKNLISMKFAKSNQFHIYFEIALSKSSFKS